MMRTTSMVLVAAAAAYSYMPAQDSRPAELWLPAVFGDHMVLSANTKAPVWGRTAPGAVVAVQGSWSDVVVEVPADAAGKFRCDLPTPGPGGPFTVEVRAAGRTRQLQDVLVGLVWLGSGQSNMEMPVGLEPERGWNLGVDDSAAAIAAADLPQLRLFTVRRDVAAAPKDDVAGQWQVCSPATVARFSATAFFFGRRLQAELKVPVGLVVSCWGGTIAEAWTSSTGLQGFPEFAPAQAELAAIAGITPEQMAARREAFWTRAVAAPAVGAAAPVAVDLPHVWSQHQLGDHDGIAVYTRPVPLPPALQGQDLLLRLGPIDDMDRVYVGDTLVGATERMGFWNAKREYRINRQLTAGAALALRVVALDTGGEGGLGGQAEDYALAAADGGAAVPLAAGWAVAKGPSLSDLGGYPTEFGGNPNIPTVLWNAMLAPLVPFAFDGAIWYQGESNRWRHEQYARLFPAMIADWRRAFGRPLPFWFVQIAPFGYGDEGDATTPLLRLAQQAALQLPATGMVVTMDVGDERDIHPRNKRAVGERLALQALHKQFGRAVVADGPRCRGVTVEAAAVRVRFDGADGGLQLRAGDGPVGFELAGSDGRYVAATVAIDGDSVVLQCPQVPTPVAVRYGFSDRASPRLQNGAGLPAWPFHGTVAR